MNKESAYPTPKMIYQSSLRDADLIQESIDLSEDYIDRRVNRHPKTLIIVDDDGNEVKKFEFDITDMEVLAKVRENIEKDKERLALVHSFIAELVEENPELASMQ